MKKIIALILASLNMTNVIAEIPLPPYQSTGEIIADSMTKGMELSMMKEQILTMRKQRELMDIQRSNEKFDNDKVENEGEKEMENSNLGILKISESVLGQVLKVTGSTYQYSKGRLMVYVNQTKVIEMIPAALVYGFYKSGATENLLLSHPTVASELSALFAIRNITSYIYNTSPSSNMIHVKVYLKHPNINGVDTENLLYSMDVNKNLMNSLDWNQVGLLQIANVFPNFHSSDWRKKILADELNL